MTNHDTTTTTSLDVAAQIRAQAPGRFTRTELLHRLSAPDFARAIREDAPGRRTAVKS